MIRLLLLISMLFPLAAFAQQSQAIKLNLRFPYPGLQYEWIYKTRKAWTLDARFFQADALASAAFFEEGFEEDYLQFNVGTRFYISDNFEDKGWSVGPSLQGTFRTAESANYQSELDAQFGNDFEREYLNIGLGGMLSYKTRFWTNVIFEVSFLNMILLDKDNAVLDDLDRKDLKLTNSMNLYFYLGYRFGQKTPS